MKNQFQFLIIIVFLLSSIATYAQLTVVQYKLDNGLTVILNPDKNQNDISGAVAVNTGSKNDPITATGISHYLEHLLFKGTTQLGTSNYPEEKKHLDSIYYFYDLLGQTTDDKTRAKIQLRINHHSVEASKYAMPNEFDKLLKSIGSTGINASTSNDLTIYYNTFPSQQIQKWLDIYAERFQDPVFRSFQSELEVVYEEKNCSMDNMQNRVIEAFTKEFYKGHPYGDKTTIGTIEHLKNPSLNKMYAYFKEYYVANNMALILSGNFDVEIIKPFIEKTFGNIKSGKVPNLKIENPRAFNGKEIIKERITPIKVGIYGFRTVPSFHKDEAALNVASYLLQNEAGTGFIDELANKNKIMMAFSYTEPLDEAGSQVFVLIPKVFVQSFKSVEKLLSQQLNKLKEGKFSDNQLEAIKNEIYKDNQLAIESASNRVYLMANAYRAGLSWEQFIQKIESVDKVTKEDVQRVSKQYFGDNYLAFRSKTGFPKKKKLEKPPFEPLQIDQNQESIYGKYFDSIPEEEAKERYINFSTDLNVFNLADSSQLFVVRNPVNDIYELKINFRKGEQSENRLEPLSVFMQNAFPKGKSLQSFKEEFGVFGSNINFSSSPHNFTITLTGIEKNMTELINQLNLLIAYPEIDENGIKALNNAFKTGRKQEELDGFLIAKAMIQYGLYGNSSVFKNRLSLSEISNLDQQAYLDTWNEVMRHAVSIHFTGKMQGADLKSLLEENLALNYNGLSEDVYNFPLIDRNENEVLVIDNKRLVQSHLFFLKNSTPYENDKYAVKNVFNQYFGGGFSGILTQEVREYRSLAYSSSAKYDYNFTNPPQGYFYTYIGTQADKTNAAATLSYNLIQEMPKKPERFELLKKNVILSKQSDYPIFRDLSKTVEYYQLMGFNQDPNEMASKDYDQLTFDKLLSFYQKDIQPMSTFLGIHGDLKKFNLNDLEQIGKVRKIKREEVIQF